MTDPYARNDAYGGGHQGPGHGGYGPNNHMNDPYFRRDAFRKNDPYTGNDPYAQRDPYAARDPYALKDPYENMYEKSRPREGGGEKKPFIFWFWLKREMQMVFSSDVGLQDENRVMHIDEDLYRIRVAAGIAFRTLTNLFVVPLVILASLALMANVIPSYKVIVIMIYLMFIAWFLYFPTWQVVSAGEYAISENSTRLYKLIRKFFKGYRSKTVAAYVLTLAALSLVVYKPDFLSFNIYQFKMFEAGSTKHAYLLLSVTTIVALTLYYMYNSSLTKKMLKNREINIKRNVESRMTSEFERVASSLDEAEIKGADF